MPAYVKEFSINLGLMNTKGSLYPMLDGTSEKATQVKLACPECATPTLMEQSYTCTSPNHHGPYKSSECTRAKVNEDKTMEFADKDEIKTAKQASDFPNDTVTISAHPTTEVWHNTYPTGTAYVFIPEGSEANMMLYGLLLDTLSNRDQDVAYVGYGVIRKTEKLVRVQRWRDRIVVQQLAYPDQVNDFPGVPVVPVNRHIEQARTFVYNGIGQFKPEEFTNKTRERLVATIGAEIESWSGDRAARPVDVQDDFMEKLRASFPQD